MTDNKKTILKYMEGFRTGDHEKILSCLTDTIVWEIPGMFFLTGKEAFDKEIENDDFEGRPTIRIVKMVEEHNYVVVEGEVKCKRKEGGYLEALICEVFHMENEKIKQLTTYQMNKQALGNL